jgi:hypothetical protein
MSATGADQPARGQVAGGPLGVDICRRFRRTAASAFHHGGLNKLTPRSWMVGCHENPPFD